MRRFEQVDVFTARPFLQELPFAGQPTLGSAHAAIEAGSATPKGGKLRQECGAGVLDLRLEGKSLTDSEIWLGGEAVSCIEGTIQA